MPQFMQRAAWSRVSFSESGTTNSLKCFSRSATGVYLRSCRSISRKPVTLPILELDAPALSVSDLHPEERHLRRVSKDVGPYGGLMVRDGASRLLTMRITIY